MRLDTYRLDPVSGVVVQKTRVLCPTAVGTEGRKPPVDGAGFPAFDGEHVLAVFPHIGGRELCGG